VATTTGLKIAAGTTYATKALLAIGGKALDNVAVTIGSTPTTRQIFVRVPSPTYAFSMTDGSAASARRNVVNSAKCLGCHRGTLYQHGGDRVDNPQLCVICHNPSAGDKSNRLTRFQIVNADGTVNRDATYDGKTNETFDFRNLLHSIHGAEKRDNPIVIYRSRGIYAFTPPVFETRTDATHRGRPYDVEVGYPKPTGWPDDGMTIYGSQNGSTIAHNWTVVHFPQPANKCTACHDAGAYEAPDQTKAVAVTVEPGTSWSSQTDDISIGPTAAACTACHATSVARSHALHQGYMANVDKSYMVDMSQPEAFWVLPLAP
jgi:OmcA/MtrC family decaheme c-type cytochrome